MRPTTDYTNDPKAKALATILRGWLASHPNWHQQLDESGWRWRRRAPTEIAVDLVPALEQMDVRLAGVLESPDGQLIRTVVGWVLLPQQAFLFDVFTDAVILAAQTQNRGQKVEAGVLAGAALVLFAGLLLSATDGAAAAGTSPQRALNRHR